MSHPRTITLVLIVVAVCVPVCQAQFTNSGIAIGDYDYWPALAWGDYDSDGDLDLAIAGDLRSDPYSASRVYRNDGGGSFVDIAADLPTFWAGALAWGDYDGDGDLDLALAGGRHSHICRNDGDDGFTDINAGLQGVENSSLAWGDYDNDGDLDLALAGGYYEGSTYKCGTLIYRNNGDQTFSDTGIAIQGINTGNLAWGDYDNDGDLDLAVTGDTYPGRCSKIYRNEGGSTFTDTGADLIALRYGMLAWGDYDSDGDLDLVISGAAGSPIYAIVTRLYRNTGGTFADSGIALPPVGVGSIAWGDYDNDGDPDLLLTGDPTGSGGWSTKVCRNDGGTFTDIGGTFPQIRQSDAAWGDYDGDGDLDFVLAGAAQIDPYYACAIFRNDTVVHNAAPSAPADLSSTVTGSDVTFSWSAASDAQTPADGLSYNLRVGTAPGKDDILSGMANPTSGVRRLPDIGNVQKRLSWKIKGLPPGTCYWSVQAVDSAFAGSPWACEATATVVGTRIFGYVRTTAGAGVEGVELRTANAHYRATTDGVGHYEIQVPSGWTGTVTPVKSLWYFGPTSLSYTNVTTDQADQDYTAHPYPSISGYVRTAAGVGVAGVTVTADNNGTSCIAGSDGSYSVRVPANWSGSVTPAKAGYAFTPANRPYANVASDQTTQDYAVVHGFTDIGAGLTGVQYAGLDWGDFDLDGDLDLAVSGNTGTKVYRNNGGAFADIQAGLPAVSGDIAWGDYDNDGDLDLALAGMTGGGATSKVYRNDGDCAFTDIGASITPVSGICTWGDYDNDGDLDLAVAGYGSNSPVSKIFRNDAGTFVDANAGLAQLCGECAWGDYDGDGDLDIAVAGYVSGSTMEMHTKVYRNDEGVFTDIGAGIIGVWRCSLAWGDYDNDGDLDLALIGRHDGAAVSYVAKVYRNDSGMFVDSGASLQPIDGGQVTWGDYDNDGDLDLALCGYSTATWSGHTRVYRNDGNNVFTDISAALANLSSSDLAWGDYDNDGDLDLALAGVSGQTPYALIYRNDGPANTRPSAPTGLSVSISGSSITFSWSASTDTHTPMNGLSYNLRVGTSPGGNDILSGMANPSSGVRLVSDLGNAQKRLSWTVKGLQPDSRFYYWSVQAIDTGFLASAWAAEKTTPVHISGRVTYNGWYGLSGVTVTANNGGGSATTDANGNYDLVVPGAWSGTVTPGKAGYWFNPISLSHTAIAGSMSGQDFVGTDMPKSGVALPGYTDASIAWGDYNNDGSLDAVITGNTASGASTRIYRAQYTWWSGSYSLTDIGITLPGISNGEAAWGDYDNDGDLDLALAGSGISRIYKCIDGWFYNIAASVVGVSAASLAWGDYDNDGDPDLVLSGDAGGTYVTRLYRNMGGDVFQDVGAALPGIAWGSLAWGDYDIDGDLDLALAGTDSSGIRLSRLCRNDSGTFVGLDIGMPGISCASLAWGDYDSDGDPDLAFTGLNQTFGYPPFAYYSCGVMRNNGVSGFSQAISLQGLEDGGIAWGDVDNDGDLDLAMTGEYTTVGWNGYYTYPVSQPFSAVYRNNGSGSFQNMNLGLPAVMGSAVAWGDIDRNGTLDLLLVGNTGTQGVCQLYVNQCAIVNSPPSPPAGLSATNDGSSVTFSWTPGSDDKTPAAGLSYNLRVGTSPGSDNVFSGMANPYGGMRRVMAVGNAQQRLSWTIRNLRPQTQTYYWSVQTIDTSYQGSSWAEEMSYREDTQSPVISSVSVTPRMAAASDTLQVSVVASDDVAVISVAANDTALTRSTDTTWTGSITASSELGPHVVYITASDAAGKTANSEDSYKTCRVLGIVCRDAPRALATDASFDYLFRVWGTVRDMTSGSFVVDDGSGGQIRVTAPGYTGFSNGDLVSARGVLSTGAGMPSLASAPELITKH